MDTVKARKEGSRCEAFIDWPDGTTYCDETALFMVDRSADTPLPVCAKHLGPILEHAVNVLWPPNIDWLGGTDLRPPNAVLADPENDARMRELWRSAES